ncbi:MAG: hypothetical protein AAF385_13865 [Pseudomonadota bacterium]
MELYLRALPNLDTAVDGFTQLNVVEETSTYIRIVGVSYILPFSLLPIDATFQYLGTKVEYSVLVGIDDDTWKGLSDSKRWKAIYLYAADRSQADWHWEPAVFGTLED